MQCVGILKTPWALTVQAYIVQTLVPFPKPFFKVS